MNCIKCGAPLHGNVCDYCGCEYDNDKRLKADLDNKWCYGTLTVNGQEIKVYLGRVDFYQDCSSSSGRAIDGIMYRDVVKTHRKFTLIEL